MITIQDLDAAIAECQGQPSPNANTCIKLAAYLTIRQSMTEPDPESPQIPTYSRQEKKLWRQPEIMDVVSEMSIDDVLELFDDVVEAVHGLNPKLYASILQRMI